MATISVVMPEPLSSHLDVGQTLGPFRLVRELGSGGSGRVFLAERIEFAQRVAIKVFHPEFVRAGATTPESDSEAQLLAALDHPHIVRLLDRASAPTGERYLVMEFVNGEPVDAYCDARQLTVRQRLELLMPAIEAVAHAHQRLVLHLDLKPANLLVSEEAGAKLLDFGAGGRVVSSWSGAMEGGATDGLAALTPEFASPEQRAGEPVGVATDVFGLGLLLRLVLAGIAPGVNRATRPGRLLREALEDPAKAGSVKAAAASRGVDVAGLRSTLRGDLNAIILKALCEDPAERYGTVQALYDDLDRYLRRLPIAARQTGRAERTAKWISRHRLATGMAALLLLAIVISGAGVAWSARAAARERRIAELRLHELVRLTGTLDSELYGSVRALPNAGSSPEAAEAQRLLTRASAETLDSLAGSVDTDRGLRYELAGQYEQLARLELAETGDAADRAAERRLAVEHLRKALLLLPAEDGRRAELEQLERSAQESKN